MRKETLDELIRDSFSDYLVKGEKILWEGKPIQDYSYTIISTWFLLFFSLFSISIYQSSKSWLSLSMFLILIVLPFVYTNFKQIKKQRKVMYAITQQRVFFRQQIDQKIQINSISFEHIPRVYLNNYDGFSKKGDISFLLKKPAKGKFWTYTIDNNHPHELPTFEHVKNPKEIIQLLQQQIKNVNTSL